jgi:hypothetical protein
MEGDLTYCHSYGYHSSVCQFYADTYIFAIWNSKTLTYLPLSLIWHATQSASVAAPLKTTAISLSLYSLTCGPHKSLSPSTSSRPQLMQTTEARPRRTSLGGCGNLDVRPGCATSGAPASPRPVPASSLHSDDAPPCARPPRISSPRAGDRVLPPSGSRPGTGRTHTKSSLLDSLPACPRSRRTPACWTAACRCRSTSPVARSPPETC